jgi:hypothetical protein
MGGDKHIEIYEMTTLVMAGNQDTIRLDNENESLGNTYRSTSQPN